MNAKKTETHETLVINDVLKAGREVFAKEEAFKCLCNTVGQLQEEQAKHRQCLKELVAAVKQFQTKK